ncbi:hypothetical protein D9757_000894 [Collybiopsis confluens]|uniref:Uncharacterized protein n=1 Tax=Collybiopsis confluens TaxID=2823264 RepID=A0A8H5I0D0_9AGAR|nr:hypothetical protein D9757_000894 [Collybiopsis confluens]
MTKILCPPVLLTFQLLQAFQVTSSPNPNPQFTYVAFGVGDELPEPLNSNPSATEWVVPIGTGTNGETTYMFNQVETVVTDEITATLTTHTTQTGTLIASASGFTLSVISTGVQGLVGAEAECHYTADGSGVCVQNLHGEGDLLTLTISGSAATHALSVSVSGGTSSGDSTSSASTSATTRTATTTGAISSSSALSASAPSGTSTSPVLSSGGTSATGSSTVPSGSPTGSTNAASDLNIISKTVVLGCMCAALLVVGM